jgi:hypothetical protein
VPWRLDLSSSVSLQPAETLPSGQLTALVTDEVENSGEGAVDPNEDGRLAKGTV